MTGSRSAFALGLALALAGCLSMYLGAAHQRLRARPWPAVPARVGGALLLVAAQVTLLLALRPVAACFVLATWAMLVFMALPALGALRRSREDVR